MNPQVFFDPERHEYYDSEGIRKPSVTWILSQSGLCDLSFVEEEMRLRAMARGKSVHWLLQLEDEGVLDYRRVPNALKPFRRAYLNWKRGSGFVPKLIESLFISDFGFAGTLDRYGLFPPTEMFPLGSKAIVDFKTGSVCDWVRFQLAAYSVHIQPNPALAKWVRRIGLALLPDGTYKVREFPAATWQNDFSVFMEAKKRVLERSE